MNNIKLYLIPLIITFGIFPMTMNSADIYEFTKGEGKIVENLNESIILDDDKLNSTVVFIKTNEEYGDPQIFSSCQNEQNLIFSQKNEDSYIYAIYLKIGGFCNDRKIYIKNGDEIYKDTVYDLNIYNYSGLFNSYTNLDNSGIEKNISTYEIYNMQNEEKIRLLSDIDNVRSRFQKLIYSYYKGANDYKIIILSNIADARKNMTYISPVKGKSLPIKKNLMPNALRGYRSKYTDGIHHGWDIFADKGTPVRALADGYVIRIVDNFNWGNFDKILWKDLSEFDRLTNLDIYRGNQVWLKTADGNVTFYSHLGKIYDIKEGDYIKSGKEIGEVDKSGVPDKEYTLYHLHFEIQVNPHDKSVNTYNDIMKWSFFGKGLNTETLITSQNKLFSSTYYLSKK